MRNIGLFAFAVAALAAGCGDSSTNPAPTAGLDASADASLADAAAADGNASTDAAGDAASSADGAGEGGGDAGPAQSIGVPLYVDPSTSPTTWSQMTSAAPTVALLVANPASGPGAKVDASYTQAIAGAHAAGQTVIGYVHTSFGARPIADVETDIDAWYSFYPAIDGIFSDETSTDPTKIAAYYKPIYEHVKGKGGARVVALNPGTATDEAYMQVGDIVVTFEDTYANYTSANRPPEPSWTAKYAASRFWHLVLAATSTADMQNAVSLARARRAGRVFVTDQGPSTAYSQIVAGSYWQAELAAVRAP